ncbi:MAG: flagellar protein FlaG [Clostridia bacterium]
MAIERISAVRGVGVETQAVTLQWPGQGAGVALPEWPERETARNDQISREEIERAAEELNRALEHVNQRLSFKIHEGSERMIVYVIDRETNEVVRELPPEKFLDTIAKIREFIGVLFDAWF